MPDPPAGCDRITAMDELSRLALAAADGDHVALRRFVRATQPQVWQLCAYLGSPQDADDLSQETYFRAIRGLAGYRGDAPVVHWLLGIARRVCADEVRRRQRRRRALALLVRSAGPTSTDPAAVADLDALIGGLDEERRAAFVLTQILGYRYEEAAAICNCPIGTIRSRVARARMELVESARAAEAR